VSKKAKGKRTGAGFVTAAGLAKLIRARDAASRALAKIRSSLPPPALSARARPWWGRVNEHLDPLQILTEADMDALVALCEALAEWQDAANGKGTPASGAKAIRRALPLYERFGLTPAARGKRGRRGLVKR